VEAREIIKAAVLSAMITTMKPDTSIDDLDQYVHYTTVHAFSIIAAALMPVLLPFLKATCQSKNGKRDTWESKSSNKS
jgi:hypothetical protein